MTCGADPIEIECPTCGGLALSLGDGEYDSIVDTEEFAKLVDVGFGRALEHLRAGRSVRRASWDPGSTLVLRGLRIEHVVKCYGASHRTSWLPTHEALLADDWEVG